MRFPDPHAAVPLSADEHTHHPAGHAAGALSHVIGRVLRLILTVFPLITRVHSPAVFITAVFTRPWLHSFAVVELIFATELSTYALFAASALEVGVATFNILLFAMSSDLRMVVVPFTSSAVAGVVVAIPILLELSVEIIAFGGLAITATPKITDHVPIRISPFLLPFILLVCATPYGA